MAEGLNRVMLLGNLGQDPELKTTPGGQAVLNIRLATTETYFDKNQTKQERTDWHTVVVWGKRAEALARILHKGSQIFVEGRIQTRSYEKNGEKRYATDINAQNIVLCGGRREGAGDFEGGGAPRGGGRSFGGGGGGGGGSQRPQPSYGGGGGGGGAGAPPAGGGGGQEPSYDDFANDPGDDEIPF